MTTVADYLGSIGACCNGRDWVDDRPFSRKLWISNAAEVSVDFSAMEAVDAIGSPYRVSSYVSGARRSRR